MGILAWIVVGLIGGAIAKMLMPGDDPGGIVSPSYWALQGPSSAALSP